MKYITCFAMLLVVSFAARSQEITAPNGKIKLVLHKPSAEVPEFQFSAFYKQNNSFIEVLKPSKLGLVLADAHFVTDLKLIKESKPKFIHDSYQMASGKRKHCENFGTEKIFSFQNVQHQLLNIVFRVYNNGVAFRYELPEHSATKKNILEETTTYTLPDVTNRWFQPFEAVYENYYPLIKPGTEADKAQKEWGYPALYQVNDLPVFVLLSEAEINENNCAAHLSNYQNKNQYKVTFPWPRSDFSQTGVVARLPWASQWHTMTIGTLSEIVASNLITDVSRPNQIKQSTWIKPGAVSWVYWANNNGSKDYKKVKEYVDGAAAMHWPYILIDWQWDIMGNGGNIIDAVNYAKSKSIKPLVWYNSSSNIIDTSEHSTDWMKTASPIFRLNNADRRTKEFEWLHKIGVYGIKVDFFAGDQQDIIKYYLDILKDAARYQLMVNFHGATLPRGWQRTYPNLMTTEAVYGAEWYNNNADLTNKAAAHNTTLPFTRNVVGSMDYTPVTFSHSQHPHITSYAHELALAVVFESGWQHFADRPEVYQSLPEEEKSFLKNFPAAWDDTKLVDGYPGEKVIIARRKDSQWYVGGLNGKDIPQKLILDFNFLNEGTYELQLFKDGADDKSFSSEKRKIKKSNTIYVECLARGGFAGVIKKINGK